jgi:gliding motility-associated-like protein
MRQLFRVITVLSVLLTTSINRIQAQFDLEITQCTTVQEVIALIDTVFLDGVSPSQIGNITFTGNPEAVGYFTGGYIFGFSNPQGIVMSSGFARSLDEDNSCNSYMGGETMANGDGDLTIAAGQSTLDACVIEIEFTPTGDTVMFNYAFGSEEYHEWVNTQWNDVFGFFLRGDSINGIYSGGGINIALVPGTTLPVSISNVNCGREQTDCQPPPGTGPNCEFLNSNTDPSNPDFYQTALDAYTDPFVADNEVIACGTYVLKLAIGDAGGDRNYDSGVFLEKGSFDPGNITQSTAYSHPTVDTLLYESCKDHVAELIFSIASVRNDPFIIPYTLAGTAEVNNDYLIYGTGHPDTIYIPAGSLHDTLWIKPFSDDLVEGIEDVQVIYNPAMCNIGIGAGEIITIFISDLPDFPDTNLTYSTYCEDTISIGFEDILGGVPPYDYTWYENGSSNPVSNTAYLEYGITGTNSNYFYCVINDTCGLQSLDTAFITVPELNTSAGPDKSLCNQPSVQLDGTSLGAQHFLWTSNPIDPSLAGQENDSTPILSPTQTTEYILLATDNCTNADQDTAIITLDGAIANASPDGSICRYDSITLSCNVGNSGETYLWWSTPNDPGLALQETQQIIKVSPTQLTNYYVEVTDACNYKDVTDVEVLVHSLPVASAGLNDDVCLGSDYNLVASGGVSYSWGSIPADPSLSINQQDTLASPIVTPDTETIYSYFVEVTNTSGCISFDTMELTVNHVPDIQLNPDNETICFGDTAIITAVGDIADSYSWTSIPVEPALSGVTSNNITITPDTTTTYFLTATIGGINCPAKPEYKIQVIPQLFAAFEIKDNISEVCENETAEILYNGNATFAADYEWDFGSDAIVNSGSNQGPYGVSWTSEGLKTITLNLKEDNCESDTVSLDIIVIANPVTDFEADPETGCSELNVSFTNLSTRLNSETYLWNFDGITSTDTNTSHTFINPGDYSVTLTTTNRNICENSITKNNTITVYELPNPEFEADPPETILEEGTINFINSSSSNDIMTYKWDFDDGDSSSLANPEHKYNSVGLYLVNLIATTSFGCQSEVSKTVTIHPDNSVFPPNVFTPNGDGENDTFKVKGDGVNSYALRIFSRWGELIFESTSLNDEWDGYYNGNLVPPGTYVYKINYSSMIDQDYSLVGSVTVIR